MQTGLVARGSWWEVGEVAKGSQKVPTSSYKSWVCDVQHGDCINNTVLPTWKLLRKYILKVLIAGKKL